MRCSAAIIELLRYSRFGDELLLLELAYANNGLLEKRTPKPARAVALAASSATHYGSDQPHTATPKPQGPDRSFAEIKASLSAPLLHTLAALEDLTQSFSDNVRCKELRLYTAFKTLRNFASVVLQRSRLLVYSHLDAAVYVPQIQQHIPATRDVSAIGHWGTGDIEVSITHLAELHALEAYLRLAYEA